MDTRLKNAMDGIDALSHEVREGSFMKNIPPGKAKVWRHGDIAFATEVLDPERDSSRGNSPSFTIITPHPNEAGALFDRIIDLFRPLLDECIEHDFLDRLGEAALEYSGYANPSDQTAVNLLKILLSEAEDILGEMREGEFPHTTGLTKVPE